LRRSLQAFPSTPANEEYTVVSFDGTQAKGLRPAGYIEREADYWGSGQTGKPLLSVGAKYKALRCRPHPHGGPGT